MPSARRGARVASRNVAGRVLASGAGVRIGIGKPPSKERGADHVLSRLGKRERELLDESIDVAGEAVELIATDGVDAAMRATN